MMMDYITIAGFLLAVFVTGVAVGKFVDKIERYISRKDDEEHGNTQKKQPPLVFRRHRRLFFIKYF